MKIQEKHIIRILLMVILLPLLYFAGRIFITDRFIVRGASMVPTLWDGEAVYVRKWLMGPRIYTSFDFDCPELKSFRIPGVRKVRNGDIVAFNYPYGRDSMKIQFKINYVYIKRCIGVPGDTVSIENGYYRNSAVPEGFPHITGQRQIGTLPDSLSGYARGTFPYDCDIHWTVKQFGPVVVPRKGLSIQLTRESAEVYADVIEFETGKKPLASGSYTFKNNYYFFVGDNAMNSRDSRFFGFVPESYIIGII